jgi:hypothetical protein
MAIAQAPAPSTVDHAWDGVFPLPLTPMETFMMADGRPGYPMFADVQLAFDGVLDRDIFAAALAAALVRNPLFCCIVGRDPRLGLVWLQTDQTPDVDWSPLGTPLGDRYDATIDLKNEIGLRIWVRQGTDSSTVLLHFHHACADGMGMFAFVEDLLALYSTFCPGGPAVALRPLEPARLLRRGLASIPQRRWYQHPFDLFFGLREALRFFLRAPSPIAAPKPAGDGTRAAGAEMLTRSLGPELTARLRRAATKAKATVNDILLCNLFATLQRWNAAHGQAAGRKWLRILMPQNLREPEDSATPTANIMSFAFLTRRANCCESAAALMPALHAEAEAIRRDRLSVFFLGSLAAALSAGVLDKLLASKICFSTVVLSNLGLPSRRFVAQFPQTSQGLIVGNTIFRSLTAVPPLRPGTRAAFAIISSADDLTLTLKCDPQYFEPIDAARLLDEYVNQLAATAAGGLTGKESH